MKILVAYTSQHQATAEIAEAIGATMASKGHKVDVRSLPDDGDASGYDAFIIGGAVYAGKLLKPVAEFIQAHEATLRSRPAWLFSSGPIGDPPFPKTEAPEVEELAKRIDARGHVVFGGKMDQAKLGFLAKLVARIVKVKPGDYRNWTIVIGWADSIAEELKLGAEEAALR